MKPRFDIFIGFDPREADAFMVAKHTAQLQAQRLTRWCDWTIRGISLAACQSAGVYYRPVTTKMVGGRSVLWDSISEAPMSTEFAITRFLTPHLAGGVHSQRIGWNGSPHWALFTDCDMLFRAPLDTLWHLLDEDRAVMCVKHDHRPDNATKMDGQAQTTYPRKNWSSVMAFNMRHTANAKLTVAAINEQPGRELHAFSWLDHADIGALPTVWNYLVGHTRIDAGKLSTTMPAIVHFTDGVPSMVGYKNADYSTEWRAALAAAAGARAIGVA